MATNNQGFVPLNPTDIQDPTLNSLNNQLQRLWAATATSNSSGSSSGSWTDYTPAITATPGPGMTITGPFTTFWGKMLNDGDKVFINIDVEFAIGGAGNSLFISMPNINPASNQFGNILSCFLYPGSSNQVLGAARVDVNTVTATQGIFVARYDGANFAAATYEIVITGYYEI